MLYAVLGDFADIELHPDVVPNEEFGAWRWVDRAALAQLASPLNVRQFGYLALDAQLVSTR